MHSIVSRSISREFAAFHISKTFQPVKVGLNLDVAGVESFIKARMGKIIDMDGCVGPINTFISGAICPSCTGKTLMRSN